MGVLTKKTKFIHSAATFSLFFVQMLWASPKENDDPYNNKVMRFKQPAPWLEMGADFRFRIVYDDARKLDRKAKGHDRINTRYRGRVSAKIKQSENVDFNIRLVTEPRYYHRPPSMDKQLIRHEALFDVMNFTWRNVLNMPMAATVGRQEIQLGSGWLLRDGTALDGGRTNFFDAIRLTYDIKRYNTTADLIWVENYGDSATYLKPFNDRDIDLTEQDEQGAILYLSRKSSKGPRIDGYFIYKHDHNRNTSSGYEGEIYTLGAMLEGSLNKHWKYCLEYAPQFGHKNGKELNAFAMNNQLTYCFNDAKKNRVHIGYEYLSGDDDPDKNFNKLWGRIDTWSVLYQGTIDSIDGRAYDSSNLHRVYLGWISEPTEKTEIKAYYHLLFADDNTNAGGTGGLSKSGNFRGHLLRAQIKYKVNQHLYHRFEGEAFFPGDFYNNDRNDVAVFLRYGLVISW